MQRRGDRCARVQGVRRGRPREGAGQRQHPAGHAGGQCRTQGGRDRAPAEKWPPLGRAQIPAERPGDQGEHGITPQARSEDRCARRLTRAALRARWAAGGGGISLGEAVRAQASGTGLQPSEWAAADARPGHCAWEPAESRRPMPARCGRRHSERKPAAMPACHQGPLGAPGQRPRASRGPHGPRRAQKPRCGQPLQLVPTRDRGWGMPCPDPAATGQRPPSGPSLDASVSAPWGQCSAGQTAPQAAPSIAQQPVQGLAKRLPGGQAL